MKVKPFPPQRLSYCVIFDNLIMLIQHPCQYSSWQELVEAHAEIPYQFALGIPLEYKFDVFPYLFEPTGQFSFSQLVPIPNTITDWDKQYYPTNWFLENWGSLNDANEVEVPQEQANDLYATILFICNGIPVNWFKTLSQTCPQCVISLNFLKLELIDSCELFYGSAPNAAKQYSTLSSFKERLGFPIVNGHNQNFFLCHPNPLKNFSFSRIFNHFKTLIDLASF